MDVSVSEVTKTLGDVVISAAEERGEWGVVREVVERLGMGMEYGEELGLARLSTYRLPSADVSQLVQTSIPSHEVSTLRRVSSTSSCTRWTRLHQHLKDVADHRRARFRLRRARELYYCGSALSR